MGVSIGLTSLFECSRELGADTKKVVVREL